MSWRSQGPGGDYFCRYIIRVINEGPGAYTGTLEVKDTFPNGTDLLLGPGPWTCDPAIGNTRLCKFPGIVNMPKNTARSFPVWLKVPQAVAAQHECRIRNVAKIVTAPGGTPKNTNPADDEDDAVASLPAELCKGPETKTNLEIEKRANGMCERIPDQTLARDVAIEFGLDTSMANGPIAPHRLLACVRGVEPGAQLQNPGVPELGALRAPDRR